MRKSIALYEGDAIKWKNLMFALSGNTVNLAGKTNTNLV